MSRTVASRLFRGALALSALGLACGCDEAKPAPVKLQPKAPEEEATPAAAPPALSPPTFSIDEIGPRVRYSRAAVTDETGKLRIQGVEQLRADLLAEKSSIEGKSLLLTIHRQARQAWVLAYLKELAPLAPSRVEIATESRSEYPKTVEFVLEGAAHAAPGCTLVGGILEDRATAIWRLSGGTARKRGRGMGGPDLTMTGDTIVSMAKGCDSKLFVVSGAPDVEWGLLYDLAASAMSLEKAALSQAVLPAERPTAGRPFKLGS